MREIIFRGKRVDNDEWYYGYLLQPNIISNVVSGQLTYADLFVDENTVGQYTGLKDKNGNMIFEGDIIDFDEKELGCKHIEEVKFDYEYLDLRKSDFGQWCEVIGNIHDNPELLKQFD